MKKIISILFIFCGLLLPVFAQTSISKDITTIEMSLFGFEYKKENDDARLNRIEKEIFGKENSKVPTEERIDKVKEALGIETQKEVAKKIQELQQIEAEELAKNEQINYPVIDSLESEFLKKQYKQESIYARIDRLEKSVYGAVQRGDLDSRVERLKASSTYTNRTKNVQPKYSEQTKTEEFYMSSDADNLIQIGGLEMSLFGKTFSQDPIGLRLNRLERKIFQRDFSSDSVYLRVQRLQAASLAKKTSKYYDGNKINKYASTGFQLASFVLMILAFIL